MATDFGKVFGAIGAAQVTKKGDFVKEGDYLFEVAKVTLFDGNDGPVHVAELIVREATKKGPEEPSTVGTTVSFVSKLTGPTAKVAPGKIKGFTLAVAGPNAEALPADKIAELVRESCDETKQPFKGHLVKGSTSPFTSKNGTSGHSLNFTHVPGQKKAEIAARAAAQG